MPGSLTMAKIKMDDPFFDRARQAAQFAGYSSVEEFIAHGVENEIKSLKIEDFEGQVADQLRGLAYIE